MPPLTARERRQTMLAVLALVASLSLVPWCAKQFPRMSMKTSQGVSDSSLPWVQHADEEFCASLCPGQSWSAYARGDHRWCRCTNGHISRQD